MDRPVSLDKQSLVLLRLEALAVLVVAVLIYGHTSSRWGLFALLFLTPDLSMLGYLAGPRLGAWCYNAVHTYVGPLALVVISWFTDSELHLALGLIWLAHIGFDRLLGYGLKTTEGFGFTHLGRIGKGKIKSD